MKRFFYACFIAVFIVALVPALPVSASLPLPPPPPPLNYCTQTLDDSGAIFMVCMPPPDKWNKQLVIFAHGYVSPTVTAPSIPYDQLALVSPPLPVLVNSLGLAFAMTSYPENGMAILKGVKSVNLLVDFFKKSYPAEKIYLIGASEGGLVTTLALEQFPAKYTGGLAVCAPIGNFRGQVDYFGDFRIVFDYYFKNIMPGTAIDPGLPSDTVWPGLETKIANQMSSSPLTAELFKVTKTPTDSTGVVPTWKTAAEVLWYNYFATKDAVIKLKGNPFGNRLRWYFGSANDRALNSGVKRYTADPAALEALNALQTNGKLSKPLVTMHTTGDPVVPYWHETFYNAKVISAGSISKHINIPVLRYGHCSFTVEELLAGFAIMQYMATGVAPSTVQTKLPANANPAKFKDLVDKHKP